MKRNDGPSYQIRTVRRLRFISALKGAIAALLVLALLLQVFLPILSNKYLIFPSASFIEVSNAADIYPDLSVETSKFRYLQYSSDKLDELRPIVQPLVVDKKTDLEKAIVLRKWVRDQVSAYRVEITTYNPVEILHEMQQGKGAACGDMAVLYTAALQSVGLTARQVMAFWDPMKTIPPATHVVVEVWLREESKWVVMDPTYNAYFAIDHVKASALDLHNYLLYGVGEFEIIRDGAMTGPSVTPQVNYYLSFYKHLLFDVRVARNPWLTRVRLAAHRYLKAPGLDITCLHWTDAMTEPFWINKVVNTTFNLVCPLILGISVIVLITLSVVERHFLNLYSTLWRKEVSG